MSNKFSIIMLLLVVILSVSVSALIPVVNYAAINDTINTNDTFTPALYSMSIKNNDVRSDRFQLYTISPFWNINPTIVTAEASSTVNFDLEISLSSKEVVGPQLVPITIKSLSSGDTVVENLYVYAKPTSFVAQSYVPNIAMDINMNDQVDPRQPISIDVYMRNRNPLDLGNLKIVVDSQLFTKEYITTLGPLEEKTNQILFSGLNRIQQPGTYNVTVKLVVDNKTVTQVQKEIEVINYSDVNVEDTTIRSLFSYTERLKIHNDGNNQAIKTERVPKSWLERVFTTTSAKYNVVNEDGVSYISWSVPLDPQQTYEISVTTNYTSVVIVVIVIIALIIFYYIFRSPVLLYKRAKIVSSTDDGISDIRVKLHLKNRSGQLIKNIKIVDKYPKIVALVDDNSIGSLKPTKMLSADKIHSMLMWNIEQLEPYEERLLTYTLNSRLNIVGNMSLHPAKVRFQSRSGERSYTSNDVELIHKSENIVQYE